MTLDDVLELPTANLLALLIATDIAPDIKGRAMVVLAKRIDKS